MDAWKRYWFSPAPCFDLATVRIIACATQLILVLWFAPQYAGLEQRAALPDELYRPFPILNLLNLPLGWGGRPDFALLEAIYFVSIAAGFLSLVGLLTNLSLVIFAATSVYLQAYMYAFSDWHHHPAAMMVALTALALSPAGRVLSVDAWWRRRRNGHGEPWLDVQSEFAGWPIKLLQWFFVLMYMSAVFNKLSYSGLDWANGYTLQYHLAEDGYRYNIPLGLWLSQFHYVVMLGQIGVLAFQATFVLAVIFPWLRWIYVPAGVLLHTTIYLALRAAFFQWIALYCVFIPWSRVAKAVFVRSRGAELRSRSAP